MQVIGFSKTVHQDSCCEIGAAPRRVVPGSLLLKLLGVVSQTILLIIITCLMVRTWKEYILSIDSSPHPAQNLDQIGTRFCSKNIVGQQVWPCPWKKANQITCY
jgi:hypothetical protein